MEKQKVDILVISLTSPLLVGIYKEGKLVKDFISQEKTSEILPTIFDQILEEFTPQNLYFAKGPGSFMAIKITYIFLQTLSISSNVPLFATDGFAFNQNSPIKAIGKLYFTKKDGIISAQKIDTKNVKILPFSLPRLLDKTIFTNQTKPLYVLPAV